jgi:hypothetical protein
LKYSSFGRYSFEFAVYKAARMSNIMEFPVFHPQPAEKNPKKSVPVEPTEVMKELNISKTETVELSWDGLLNVFSKKNPKLASSLMCATLVSFSNDLIVLNFKEEYRFHYDQVTKDEAFSQIEFFFKGKLSDNVKLRINLICDGSVHPEKSEKKNIIEERLESQKLSDEKLLQEVLALPLFAQFKEVFNVKPEDVEIIK